MKSKASQSTISKWIQFPWMPVSEACRLRGVPYKKTYVYQTLNHPDEYWQRQGIHPPTEGVIWVAPVTGGGKLIHVKRYQEWIVHGRADWFKNSIQKWKEEDQQN